MGRAVLVLMGVIGCSTPDPELPSLPHGSPVAQAIGLGMSPMSIDDRGIPRLLQVSPSYRFQIQGSPAVAALAHVERLAPAWGVEVLPSLSTLGEVAIGSSTIVRVEQRIAGLPIDGGELRALVRPTGELIAVNGTLIDAASRAAPRFELDDAGAIGVAVGVDASALSESPRGWTGRAGTIDVPLAAAKRMWVRHGGQLIAGWIVEAYLGRTDSTHSDLVRVVVAGDGRVLERTSLVADVAFKYRVFADTTGDLRPLDGPIADVSPHPTGIPDGGFPGFVAPQLITVDGLNHPPNNAVPDPWLPSNRTETFGNNVDAYADLNAPSGLTFGDFRATATSALTFDRTYDTAVGPLTSQPQQMASITSLFYVINWLHDFWYDAGFTEAAGNAQDANFGRGGEDRDAMLAEAQDNALGGSRNNANMSTPSDGLPPRMQVFLWSGLDEHTLGLQPSGRTPAHGVATYGIDTFDVTAEVVLANDGTGDNPHDLCEPIVNDVTGKIVLVDRGICTFESKALKIQNAGGVGMILANNNANNPPTMGDDVDTTDPITIAQLSILQTEGVTLEEELLAGTVTAAMHRLVGPELDGAIDATLIAHEFGHYLHHRLQQCNTRLCSALSEGWGDFLSLMIMARAGDDLTGAYPFAVYSTRSFSDDAQYFGIRRAPYSVDPAINALSFRHMAAGAPLPDTHPFLPFGVNNEVHNAGEIWAAALWEAYVALQQAGTSFDAVRDAMARYVV
ncbi:MAG: M36 family metallopeptidase, partial [Deltaproteobacteria bacterium]|nr:M36 family metallopeptidase [Deltaproteobacteria bacterium]